MKVLTRKLPRWVAVGLAIVVGAAFFVRRSSADQIPAGWKASNMKPIGYSGLNGIGESFKMAVRQVNGRWYLYMGHFAHWGWSILDVTDPTNPKYVKFVPGPDNTETFQMEFHDNLMLTSMQRSSENWGGDADKPYGEGVILWDITDPVNPKQLSVWKTGSTGIHRIGYPGGKYASLAANMPGFRGQILVFLDVSDPKNPKEAGRWWEPGQKEGEEPARSDISFHGPATISADGKTAYLGYSDMVLILDISDIAHPKPIGELRTSPPFRPGGTSNHDALIIPGKDLLFAHSEATSGDTPSSLPCTQALSLVGLIDIKDQTKPRLVSIFPTPVPPPDVPYTDFCDKGGRFGPHNTNLEQHLPDVEKQADLVYLTYFNAGLRIFNIKDPRLPKEVGWFIPPMPTKRATPIPRPALVDQTEDVVVDTRGNIYISDKQWGVFILRYSGSDEPAPTAK